MWKLVAVAVCAFGIVSVGYCTDYDQVLKNARILAKAGNKQAAANLLQTAAGSDTDHGAEWLRAYALIWRDAPKRDAIAQFLKVADRFPTSPHAPDALLHAGYLRDEIGEDAGPDWERLVQRHPRTKEAAEALHCLGHRALRNRNPELAIRTFKEAAAVPEADRASVKESLIEAGYACISQYWRTWDKKLLREALDTFPNAATVSAMTTDALLSLSDTRVHLGRGEVYLILGLGNEAAHEYQSALDNNPTDPYQLGVAQFELGCSLYAKRDWTAAETAFNQFLDSRSGQTLADKQRLWKDARPGYLQYLTTDPTRAAKLSGLELVLDAAYWKAATLVELKQYRDAKQILVELSAFPEARTAKRAESLRKMCAHMLGEDKPVIVEEN